MNADVAAPARRAHTNTIENVPRAAVAVALLTAGILVLVRQVVSRPMVLADRFFPGSGWVEIAGLTAYAVFLVHAMASPAGARRWRPRIWRFFSIAFFAQLLLGIVGVERCLMTGVLHLPIPALIAAGPAFRGHSFFMVFLFLATVALVGPSWCSHLCYFGAWDDTAARTRAKPLPLPAWTRLLRPAILGLVILTALGFRYYGVTGGAAALAAGGFGIGGVVVMVFASRKSGAMVHCLAWCPIGFAASAGGKLNPFRIAFNDGCTTCGACTLSCRYDALNPLHIARRKLGFNCTLCGDCLSACPHSALEMRFPGLRPGAARTLYLVIIIALHASFVGLARI